MSDVMRQAMQVSAVYDASYPPGVLNPPVAPVLTQLSPPTISAATLTTVLVDGSGFTAASVVFLNGVAQATQLISSTTVSFPANVTAEGTANVTVRNGSAESNALVLTVNAAAPIITGVAPSTVAAGSANTPIVVTGSRFVARSQILVDGASRPTTFDSPTSLRATVQAAALATPGVLPVTVTTAAPGGGSSGSQAITVTALGDEPESEADTAPDEKPKRKNGNGGATT